MTGISPWSRLRYTNTSLNSFEKFQGHQIIIIWSYILLLRSTTYLQLSPKSKIQYQRQYFAYPSLCLCAIHAFARWSGGIAKSITLKDWSQSQTIKFAPAPSITHQSVLMVPATSYIFIASLQSTFYDCDKAITYTGNTLFISSFQFVLVLKLFAVDLTKVSNDISIIVGHVFNLYTESFFLMLKKTHKLLYLHCCRNFL